MNPTRHPVLPILKPGLRAPARRSLLLALVAMPLAHAQAPAIRIVHKEVAPAAGRAALRKLLVLAWGTRMELRRLVEDAMSAELKRLGVQSVAAYTRLPPDAPLQTEAVTRLVKADGYDGVLVARLIATERAAPESRVAPGQGREATLQHHLAQLQSPAPQAEDGMVAVTTTSLYRSKDGARLWSALTDVHDPRDLPRTTRDFAAVVVAELRASKLV